METNPSDCNLAKLQNNLENQNLYLDSYPTQIHFLMIDRCNAKCIMCGGDYFRSQSGRMITLEKFKIMATNLRFENVRAIVLAGAGDPLLNPDLVQIIQFLKEAHPHITISVTTNGLGLTEKLSGLLVDNGVNLVNISINSATRLTYRRIMQVDGFDRVCGNAKAFVELRNRSGKPITLQFSAAINRLNIEDLPRLVQLGKKIGINSLNLFYTRFYPERIRHLNVDDPTDRLENEASLFFHQSLSDEMVGTAKILAQRYGIGFTHEPLFKENVPPSPCTWPMTQLMVGFDGEIYPCGGSEVHFKEKVERGIYNFGNALQDPVDAFWNNEIYRALRISSRQGERCLMPECRCCANTISPNDVRAHIMQWDMAETGSVPKSGNAPRPSTPDAAGKSTPLVSVIVPTYNRPNQLVIALKSVLAQTYKKLELIVVNDAGTDVEDVISFLQGSHPITYVKHGKNSGLASARNSGIKLARGKYIAYLDDDDLFYPRHVETLVAFLESSEYKVAYTDAYRAHQEKKDGEYVVIKRDIPYSFDFDYDRILETNFVPVLCFMHERSCAEEVGLFDESLKKLEDWDLWIRMSRKFKFAHIKQLTCEFTWRTDGTSMTSGKGHEFIEARNRISMKYGGARPAHPPQFTFPRGAEKSLVSIVVLTFNQLKYTKESVMSIRKHTPEPHEIIFVDNGSKDGTKCWLRALVKENPRYKIVENDNNLGFARGCNQGLMAASGEYLLLLNNDVLVTEGWLSGLITASESSNRIGIVGPMTNHISGPQQVPKVGYSSIADLDEYARSFREKNRYRRIPFRRIVGFCMFFRRALVEQIGLLDESFGTGNFEDDDFCLRAELAGYRNMIAGDVFIHHFGSRSFIGNKIDYRKTMKGNHNYFLEKWNSLDPQSPEGKKYLSLRGREAAKLDYEKGQAKKAVDRWLAVIRLGIGVKEKYYDLADLFLDAKQYDQAFRLLEQMPDPDERKYALLGYCQEGLANLQEAQKLAEKALSLNPSNASALNLKGILSYRKGNKEEAQDYFQKTVSTDPGFGEPHTNLGVIRWEDNRKKEALQLFERGFILSPTITDILQLYHTAVTQAGEFARAEENFYEAKALHSFHQGIRFFLIDILLKQEKYKPAMEEIEQAMGDFGIEDEMLKAALEVRKRIGPQEKCSQDRRGRISLCMIAKDEENNLVRCLRSVKPLVDEIIVVDTGSADRTKDIATALGARVFEFSWEDDFSAARNFSISQARGDWILVLDADEVISPVDHASLLRLTKVGSLKAGYSLTTRNYLNTLSVTQWTANNGSYDEEAGNGWIPSEKVRLFPRDRRIHFENPVHEFVEPSLERICISIKKCNIPVHHYGKLNEKKEKRKGEDYFLLGKKKLEKSSADIQSLRELAVQANILKRHEEAAELWHEVIRLQPNLQEAYVNLTSIYMNLGKFQEASATSQRAIELDPECKEAVLNYSIVEFTLGNLKNVISALENLLSKIPEYPLAMGLLSVAYRLDGGREKSQSLIVKIKKAGFNYDEYLQNTAKDLIALGRTAEAELLAEMMEGKEPRARFQGATLS